LPPAKTSGSTSFSVQRERAFGQLALVAGSNAFRLEPRLSNSDLPLRFGPSCPSDPDAVCTRHEEMIIDAGEDSLVPRTSMAAVFAYECE
jgi:hypothetical protein